MLFAVEDDPWTLELIRDLAAEAGWTAKGFTHLAAFERAMAETLPDLVIIDDELPDGRGGDRARELMRDGHLPVLVCTAASPRRQAEIGGWAPVISKPFDLGEIERVLQVTARKHGPRVDPAAG
jgi:DNA-binding response OmpR family regulator